MRIEVFSSPDCGYCKRAKALLERRGLAYRELDIATSSANMDEFRRRLPRAKAIPQIFIDGRHIGGYEDLCHLEETGRLDEMLSRPPGGR